MQHRYQFRNLPIHLLEPSGTSCRKHFQWGKSIITSRGPVYSIYTPFGWMAFVLQGLAHARLLQIEQSKNKRIAVSSILSAIYLILFLVLRALRGFGNIHLELLGSGIDAPLNSFVGFFNLVKYPPSSTYSLLMMSLVHLLFACFQAFSTTTFYNPLNVFGSCALFFYIMHFYVYSGARLLLVLAGILEMPKDGMGWDGEGGLGFWPFAVVWLVGLGVLYPMCLWYGRFKQRQSLDSIFRFF